MVAPTYIIADLHLDPGKPQPYELALDFLAQVHHAHALYILGDLFEYWIGDDAGVDLYEDMIDALAAVGDSDCRVTVMLGNRDFLLGNAFAQATQAKLVREDELLADLNGEPVLLMHGDTLCIDDSDYQAFRQQVRDPKWQAAFLARSIDERLAYARHLRQQSQQLSASKTHELMDVSPSQVQSRFMARQCRTMIHGHTHRPCQHIDNTTGNRRLVVGDWHPDHAIYAVHDATGLHLKRFDAESGL